MSRGRDTHYGFGAGLQTTRVRETPGAPFWQVFQNVRVSQGAAVRRGGMVRLSHFAADQQCVDFDGVNDVLEGFQRFTLGTQFTVEWFAFVDTLTSPRTILGGSTANPGLKIQLSSTGGGTLTVTMRDSAGNQTVVSLLCGGAVAPHVGQFVRDGANLTLRFRGNSDVTATGTHASAVLSLAAQGSGSAALKVGAHNGADWMDGRIDFVRGFSKVKAGFTDDAFSRLFNPRAPHVIFDIRTGLDASNHARDEGRFNNHLIPAGAPVQVATLANNPCPVQMIAPSTKANGQRLLYVVAGGKLYPVYVA